MRENESMTRKPSRPGRAMSKRQLVVPRSSAAKVSLRSTKAICFLHREPTQSPRTFLFMDKYSKLCAALGAAPI